MLLRLFNLLKLGAQVLLSLLVAVRAKELQIVFVDPDLRITVLIQQDLKAVRELHNRDVGSDILDHFLRKSLSELYALRDL